MPLEKIIDQMPLPWLPLPTTQSSLSDVTRQMYDTLSFDKEWKDLRYLPWRFFYLDYHHLQQDIINGNLAKRFETEWNKVYEFYILKKGEIERRIESTKSTRNEQEIKILFIDIHKLYHFAKLNYCGFLQLFMQYNRLFGSNSPSDLLRRLIINKPFWDHSFDLIYLANSLNVICIEQQEEKEEVEKEQVDSIHQLLNSNSSSTISTIDSGKTALSLSNEELEYPKNEKIIKKYLVHPDNIIEVMLYMSKNKMILQDKNNNPSSTFNSIDEIGNSKGIKSKLLSNIHHLKTSIKEKRNETFDKLKVTTIYMDSIKLNDYTERIIGKSIKSTRIRWFNYLNKGEEEEEKNKYISLEEKVYNNNNNTFKGFKGLGKEPQQQNYYSLLLKKENWIQQRIWFKFKNLKLWLNGNYSISNIFNKSLYQYRTNGLITLNKNDKYRMENKCLQIQDEIHNKIKVPILKTTQFRTIYISKDEKVNITIDTDIIIKQYQHNNNNNNHQIKFPYCIIQIEQNLYQENIDFISKLISSPMLEPVHDFSLYLHGVGTLLYDQVHVSPSWFSKLEILDIRHTEYRGSLLFTIPLKKEEEITTNQSKSSINSDKLYCSSNTIATIITCYDKDKEEPLYSSSSSSSLSLSSLSISSSPSSSSLLSPIPKQQGKLRRSFDSYCSFDHPTSSRSDPTNCKSCMGKLNDKHQVFSLNKKKNDNIEYVTFFSVLKSVIWPYNPVNEKEPLLSTSYKQDEAAIIRHYGYFMGFSRATVITTSCVFISFIISYLLYIFILKIK